MTNEIVAQDAHIEWDDYHEEDRYEVRLYVYGKVEPFGHWEKITESDAVRMTPTEFEAYKRATGG